MANDFSVYGDNAFAIQAMLGKVQQAAKAHNALIGQLLIKEGEVTEDDLSNARELNPRNDEKIAKYNEQIATIQAKLDEIISKANELAVQDVPKPLEGDEKAAVQSQVKDLQDTYKKMNTALDGFAIAMDVDLKDLEVPQLIHMNGRKTSGTGTPAQSGPKIRTDAVYVNGVKAELKKQNGKEGEMSSTFSAAVQKILKDYKVKINAADLHAAYFEAAGTTDIEKVKNDLTFPFTLKDDKGVETQLEMRVVRS